MNELQRRVLSEILKEATARAVNGAFEQFLESEINIPKGVRSIASDSQNHLRDFLINEYNRDNTFPRILSIEDQDFLGGSFARHTKIWPLDDIDIYLPLDGYNLNYTKGGLKLPYTVVSDGVMTNNPLINPRWMKGIYISSQKLISEFAAVLRRHYPKETEVKPNGEAVGIRMKQGETSYEKGLGYDVVPCFLLRPDDEKQLPFYLMPDGLDNWIRTNPRIDTEIAKRLHSDNNKTYRKAVKFIKYWNKNQLNGAIGSYYIELAISFIYLEKNYKKEHINSISFGVTLGFLALKNALDNGDQVALIPEAPPVEHGELSLQQRILVNNAYSVALEAWNSEKEGNEMVAISKWGKIFGDKFPEPTKVGGELQTL